MRLLLDSRINTDHILKLINRPLLKLSLLSSNNVEIILLEFCANFLCTVITEPVKNDLLPHIRIVNRFPYEELLKFLNDNNSVERNNNLLYCVLMLEPQYYGK